MHVPGKCCHTPDFLPSGGLERMLEEIASHHIFTRILNNA